MAPIEDIEQRLAKVEARNRSVELDKKWETSMTRKGLLAVFTYLAVLLYFLAIGVDSPFLNAVVPTVGFLLSTLTLPIFKQIWAKHQQYKS